MAYLRQFEPAPEGKPTPKGTHIMDTVLLLQLEANRIDLVNFTYDNHHTGTKVYTAKAMKGELEDVKIGDPIIFVSSKDAFSVVRFKGLTGHDWTPVEDADYGWTAPPSADVFTKLEAYCKTDAQARLRMQLGASIAAAKAAVQGVDLKLFVDNTNLAIESSDES